MSSKFRPTPRMTDEFRLGFAFRFTQQYVFRCLRRTRLAQRRRGLPDCCSKGPAQYWETKNGRTNHRFGNKPFPFSRRSRRVRRICHADSGYRRQHLHRAAKRFLKIRGARASCARQQPHYRKVRAGSMYTPISEPTGEYNHGPIFDRSLPRISHVHIGVGINSRCPSSHSGPFRSRVTVKPETNLASWRRIVSGRSMLIEPKMHIEFIPRKLNLPALPGTFLFLLSSLALLPFSALSGGFIFRASSCPKSYRTLRDRTNATSTITKMPANRTDMQQPPINSVSLSRSSVPIKD